MWAWLIERRSRDPRSTIINLRVLVPPAVGGEEVKIARLSATSSPITANNDRDQGRPSLFGTVRSQRGFGKVNKERHPGPLLLHSSPLFSVGEHSA